MIRGIILTLVVLTILSYFGFDLNAIAHNIVSWAIDAWNGLKHALNA